jgi:hypothetical protein
MSRCWPQPSTATTPPPGGVRRAGFFISAACVTTNWCAIAVAGTQLRKRVVPELWPPRRGQKLAPPAEMCAKSAAGAPMCASRWRGRRTLVAMILSILFRFVCFGRPVRMRSYPEFEKKFSGRMMGVYFSAWLVGFARFCVTFLAFSVTASRCRKRLGPGADRRVFAINR